MVFILGGAYQGKTSYARQTFGKSGAVCDLERDDFPRVSQADIVVNIHIFARKLLKNGIIPVDFFRDNIEVLRDKIIIGNEIGSGVVPTDFEDREWRDSTGRLYRFLAQEAERVDRVWAGLGLIIKDLEESKHE